MRPDRKNRGLSLRQQRGFTLAEMIVVMVITGILGGVVAMFIKGPVQGYVDSTRRADMSGVADMAMWRMTHELRQALPNSVRMTASGGMSYLEFIPVKGGGRYRAQQDCSGACAGDVLSMGVADTSFDVLGTMPSFTAGDAVVVDNLGTAGHSAYEVPATNRSTWASNTAGNVTFAAMTFPSSSPGSSFYVIATPVSYVCDPGTATLTRYWGYAIQAAQPTALATLTSANPGALLATKVSACSFAVARPGLVTLQLTLADSGDSISLYEAAHVNNAP